MLPWRPDVTKVQSDVTIVVSWQLSTGSMHDYLLCYCPLVGILFEVFRIVWILASSSSLEADLCKMTSTLIISNDLDLISEWHWWALRYIQKVYHWRYSQERCHKMLYKFQKWYHWWHSQDSGHKILHIYLRGNTLETILSTSNRIHTSTSKMGSHVYFLLIVAMVLLLWHHIVLLWRQDNISIKQ